MLAQVKDTAVQAAYEAGALLRRNFKKHPAADQLLPHDIKLRLDRECESLIKSSINKNFPDHGLLSEESPCQEVAWDSEYVWVVDPLDGSVNYFHGIPYFSVCIACCKRTGAHSREQDLVPQVGVVYAPLTDTLYVGVAGLESRCNGQSLTASTVSRLQDTVAGISFGSDEHTMQRMESLNRILVRRARKIRILGSTGLDLVHIAEGRLGALVQGKVRLWDFAAARVILEQSGGILVASRLEPFTYQIMACAPDIYPELRDIMETSRV